MVSGSIFAVAIGIGSSSRKTLLPSSRTALASAHSASHQSSTSMILFFFGGFLLFLLILPINGNR